MVCSIDCNDEISTYYYIQLVDCQVYPINMSIGNHSDNLGKYKHGHIYELCVMHKYSLHINLKGFNSRLYKRTLSGNRV